MEFIKTIFGLIAILTVVWFIIKITIICPIRIHKFMKLNKEILRWNKKITSTLKQRYNVDFLGLHTLQIYDFIKTNVEYISHDRIAYRSNFSQYDLLKYINLDEVYRYEECFHTNKVKEEIDYLIYNSLIEIKYYLYNKDIHFPFYRLDNSTYQNIDDKLEDEKDFIIYRIKTINKSWELTKIMHYFYLLLSFAIISFMLLGNVSPVYNVISVTSISFFIFFWSKDTREYKSIIDPLSKKLEDLESIPKDTYSLPNKVKEKDES